MTCTIDAVAQPQAGIATDSPILKQFLKSCLSNMGYRCKVFTEPVQLISAPVQRDLQAVFIGSKFCGRRGIDIWRSTPAMFEQQPVVFVSNSGDVDEAVSAMKAGALDVLSMPIDEDRLASALKAAASKDSRLERQNAEFKSSVTDSSALRTPPTDGGQPEASDMLTDCASEWQKLLVGSHPVMVRLRQLVQQVAPTRASVLISGESGTGKEVVARAIHELSGRAGAFVPVNMAAIPPGLTESLLFGHERGAYTGAVRSQPGFFEAADGGTLFLDEVCEMELHLQPKLLRCLQDGAIQRVGSQTTHKVDVRVIAATNSDPKSMVKEGKFREDLFYRLSVIPIHTCPLRERPGDIMHLANEFVRRARSRLDKNVSGISPAAVKVLISYEWPGNVRQLENVIERLVIFASNPVIDVAELPADLQLFEPAVEHPLSPWVDDRNRSLDCPRGAATVAGLSPIQVNERTMIIDALEQSDGHVGRAAKILGLGQATVYRRIKQYAIQRKMLAATRPYTQ